MAYRLPDPRRVAEVTRVIVRSRLRGTLRCIDPRLWLAAAIGWSIFGVLAVAALVAAQLAATEAERSVRADTERLLGQFSTQIQQMLTLNMQTRRMLVQTAAAHVRADLGVAMTRRYLEVMQSEHPEFSWLGFADADGRMTVATGGLRMGEDVSQRMWFRHGRKRPYLGEVHDSHWTEDAPPRADYDRPDRIVYTAAPAFGANGRLIGVVVGRMSWGWVEARLAELLQSLGTLRRLEVLLVSGDDRVLAGPASLRERRLGDDPGESGRYVVGRVPVSARELGGPALGWTVVVRQDAGPALAAARRAWRSVFTVVLLAGLLAAAASVAVTRRIARRLVMLAKGAEAVRCGTKLTLDVPAGIDEIGRIGTLLGHVVNHLQAEKRALVTLNAELDARVAERSARIERMADEARHAAVSRERLRLARDLHDTLAHSLMALLTQIRLVRKLGRRLDADEIDTELARAEDVAATGLAGARAAITQMRHNDIGDTSLDAALHALLQRFGERTGIATAMRAEPVDPLDGPDAEVVFRIVEEALRNVERHAGARSVKVALHALQAQAEARPQMLRVEVVDDGVGFDLARAPTPGHYGLRGMREQAALIEATLAVHSAPRQGTRLVLEFEAAERKS